MATRKESIFDVFTDISWQTSVVLALLVFLTLRFVLPLIPASGQLAADIVAALGRYAHLVALILLIPAPFSAFASRRRKKELAARRGVHSIRDLDRWQVEQLVAEAYRRRGYTVMFDQDGNADGAADLRLHKGGRLYLLQSRHWHAVTVDGAELRQLGEAVTSERATGGMVITSGAFTPEAKKFSAAAPIDLIGVEQLAAFIGGR